MTREISWNGVNTPHPGAYSKVDFSAGRIPTLSATGIVGIVGEADLGAPGSVLVFDEDKVMRSYFGSGPLADAATWLFRSSTDPNIPAGASRVYVYKANQSTKSYCPLFAGSPIVGGTTGIEVGAGNAKNSDSGKITLLSTGNFTGLDLSGQTFYILSGKGEGQRRVIQSNTDDKLTIGDAGSGLEFSPIPGAGSYFQVMPTQAILSSSNYGVLMNSLTFDLDSAISGGTKKDQFVVETRLGDSLDLNSGAIGNPMFNLSFVGTLSATPVYTDTAISAATTSAFTMSNSPADGSYKDLFVYVKQGDAQYELRRLNAVGTSSNVASLIHTFTVAPANDDDVEIRKDIVASAKVSTYSNKVITINTTPSVDNPTPFKPYTNELVGLVVYVSEGTGSDQRRVVTANSATAITVDSSFVIPLDSTSKIELHYISSAIGSISGTNGKANKLTTSFVLNNGSGYTEGEVAGGTTTTSIVSSAPFFLAANVGSYLYMKDQGSAGGQLRKIMSFVSTTNVITEEFSAAPTAADLMVIIPTDLEITITDTQTLQELMAAININVGYEVSAGVGVNIQKTLPSTLDYDSNNTVVPLVYNVDSGLSSFTYQLHLLLQVINNKSQYIEATRGVSGAGLPEFVSGGTDLKFQGAARGVSSNSTWQAGFDALLLHRVHHVTAAMSSDLADLGQGSTATILSVHQMVNSHIETAYLNKSERTGIVALDGSKSEIIAARAALSNYKVQITCNYIENTNAAGDLVMFPAWLSAIMATSMRAGGEDSSLTFKTIIANSVSQHPSWDPRNKTDNKDLLLNGVLFLEPAPRGGYRWVRDLTTEIAQENTLLNIGAVVWNHLQVVYNVRTAVEEEFTGAKAKPATVGRVSNFLGNKLSLEEQAGRITKSYNNGISSPAFNIKRIYVSSDIMRISYEIWVSGYIDFILIEETLQIPVFEGR